MIVTRKVRYEQRFICAQCGKEVCRETEGRQPRADRKYCSYTCRRNAFLIRRLNKENS